MTGWTKGPWQVEQDEFPLLPRIIAADGSLVAVVGNATEDYDAFEANARLIAAAVEMERALEPFVDALSMTIEGFGVDIAAPNGHRTANALLPHLLMKHFAAARAALRKSRGEA